MARQSRYYIDLVRRVGQRRMALIRDQTGRLIFPKPGTPWVPDSRAQAACESFIVLFVAELETYLEGVVGRAFSAYMVGHKASYFSECAAAAKFFETIKSKGEEWRRNNNTNWSRISGTLEFIGLSRGKCPNGMWDYIEAIASERGGIVHNSFGARNINDPRIAIGLINKLMPCLRTFDRDMEMWLGRMEAEASRLQSDPIRFTPGLGSIAG